MREAATAIQGAARSDEPNQLQLRFFAIVDGFTRRPPERALWRVLIDTALAKTEVFRLRGRAISAEAVHHVALALYMQADSAGVIHDATEEHIAKQCRMGKRHVSLARQVLNNLRVVRSIPRRGRRPGVHRMNLGGLDWPAVRRRAGKPRPDPVPDALQPALEEAPDDDRCGALGAPQSAPDDDRCGALGAPQNDRCGALEAPQNDRCGALGAPNVLRTTELRTSAAAASTHLAREDEQQQQQREAARIESLIGAVASRSREHGRPFDEGTCRCSLASGKITVQDLQDALNMLPARRRRGARL
ncbi:MAG: hypothetical protein F4Y94_05800 [Chloroflexi bacterium]|nr:hypothetical protein [Chloroflexota bacterium]